MKKPDHVSPPQAYKTTIIVWSSQPVDSSDIKSLAQYVHNGDEVQLAVDDFNSVLIENRDSDPDRPAEWRWGEINGEDSDAVC